MIVGCYIGSGEGGRNCKNRLKYPLLDPVHKGFAELFADGDLLAADKNLVVADGFEAGDIDNIRIVDTGEGGGELLFDILQAAIDEEFERGSDDADVFFFTFEVEDVF